MLRVSNQKHRLITVYPLRTGWLTAAAGGFYLTRGTVDVVGVLRHPDGGSLYRPMGPLKRVYNAPRRVKAILAGADPVEQLVEAFAEAGWPLPEPWQGDRTVVDWG